MLLGYIADMCQLAPIFFSVIDNIEKDNYLIIATNYNIYLFI